MSLLATILMANGEGRPSRLLAMEDLRDSLYARALAHYAPLLGREPLRLDEERAAELANDEVDRLLPILLQMRKASGETGPATEEEYFQASMTHSEQTSRAVLWRMGERASGVDPRRNRFLQAFMTSAEADLADLAILRDEPTEEKIRAVTDRIVARMDVLTKKLEDDSLE